MVNKDEGMGQRGVERQAERDVAIDKEGKTRYDLARPMAKHYKGAAERRGEGRKGVIMFTGQECNWDIINSTLSKKKKKNKHIKLHWLWIRAEFIGMQENQKRQIKNIGRG